MNKKSAQVVNKTKKSKQVIKIVTSIIFPPQPRLPPLLLFPLPPSPSPSSFYLTVQISLLVTHLHPATYTPSNHTPL